MKDVNGDKLGSLATTINVPEYSPERLLSSSLILADVLEPVSPKGIGNGNFEIGPVRVRPKVAAAGKPVSFPRNQPMNLWMQVYNLALDEKTGKPSAMVEYQVVNTVTHQPVLDTIEKLEQISNAGGQLTLQKRLPLDALAPGEYRVTIKVNDLLSRQSISPTAAFQVE